MLVNNQPNKVVACRADIQCISVLLCRHLGWWYWQRVNASQKWLQAEGNDDGPKVEKGEQRGKYACAHSLFVWRTRTLDRRGIWLVVLVSFWLLPANKSHVFSALPRGEFTLINWKGGSVADLLHEWLVLSRRFLRFSTVDTTQGS